MRRRDLLLLACGIAVGADAQELEFITLHHRTAEQVLPVLQPLLEHGGGLSGQGNQLFLRTTPANSRQIKQVLATLDRAPRQLTISVRQDRVSERDESRIGANGNVVISSSGTQASTQASGSNARTLRSGSAEQRLTVLEGAQATLTMGTAVPFTFYTRDRASNTATANNNRQSAANRDILTANTVYYDAVTSFNVRAQLNGNLVTLEITPQESTITPRGVESAQLSTSVQMPLGQWTAIGGADQRAQSNASGQLLRGDEFETHQRGVWVKVEEAR